MKKILTILPLGLSAFCLFSINAKADQTASLSKQTSIESQTDHIVQTQDSSAIRNNTNNVASKANASRVINYRRFAPVKRHVSDFTQNEATNTLNTAKQNTPTSNPNLYSDNKTDTQISNNVTISNFNAQLNSSDEDDCVFNYTVHINDGDGDIGYGGQFNILVNGSIPGYSQTDLLSHSGSYQNITWNGNIIGNFNPAMNQFTLDTSKLHGHRNISFFISDHVAISWLHNVSTPGIDQDTIDVPFNLDYQINGKSLYHGQTRAGAMAMADSNFTFPNGDKSEVDFTPITTEDSNYHSISSAADVPSSADVLIGTRHWNEYRTAYSDESNFGNASFAPVRLTANDLASGVNVNISAPMDLAINSEDQVMHENINVESIKKSIISQLATDNMASSVSYFSGYLGSYNGHDIYSDYDHKDVDHKITENDIQISNFSNQNNRNISFRIQIPNIWSYYIRHDGLYCDGHFEDHFGYNNLSMETATNDVILPFTFNGDTNYFPKNTNYDADHKNAFDDSYHSNIKLTPVNNNQLNQIKVSLNGSNINVRHFMALKDDQPSIPVDMYGKPGTVPVILETRSGQILTQFNVMGTVGDSVPLDSTHNLQNVLKRNNAALDDGYSIPDSIMITAVNADPIIIYAHITTIHVTHDHPYNPGANIGGVKVPKGLSYSDLNQTATRTITSSKNNLPTGHTMTQKLTFYRDADFNPGTGQITYGNWVGNRHFAEIQIPKVAGYKPVVVGNQNNISLIYVSVNETKLPILKLNLRKHVTYF